MAHCLCIGVMQLHDRHLSTRDLQAELPPWIVFSDFERTEWLTQMLGAHPSSRDSHQMRIQRYYRDRLCLEASSPYGGMIASSQRVVTLVQRSAASAAQVWPYVDSAVSDVGLQRLDKALKERRARWMLDVAVEQ